MRLTEDKLITNNYLKLIVVYIDTVTKAFSSKNRQRITIGEFDIYKFKSFYQFYLQVQYAMKFEIEPVWESKKYEL